MSKKKSKKEEELESRIKELEQEVDHLNRLINEKDAWISYLQSQVIIKLDEINNVNLECDHVWHTSFNSTAPYRTCLKCHIHEPILYSVIATNTTSPNFQIKG